jgi:hypothetical protein
MRDSILKRLAMLSLMFVVGAAAGMAQSLAVYEDPDEYGIPSISCGPGESTYEYRTALGEKILITSVKYESVALADAALEIDLRSAAQVLMRENLFDEQGSLSGLRVLAQFADKAVMFERRSNWLSATEAVSLESLEKFSAYHKKRAARTSAPPN